MPTWDTGASHRTGRDPQDDGGRRTARRDVGEDPLGRADRRARGRRRPALGRPRADAERRGRRPVGSGDLPAGRRRPGRRSPSSPAARLSRVDASRCNRVDPWGDLHADPARGACSPATGAALRRRRPARRPPPRAARRCGSRACLRFKRLAPPARRAARLDAAVLPRRRRRPRRRPPPVRVRADAPTTSPTATLASAADGPSLEGDRARPAPGRRAAASGSRRLDGRADRPLWPADAGDAARRHRRRRHDGHPPPRSAAGDPAAVHVRRLGPARGPGPGAPVAVLTPPTSVAALAGVASARRCTRRRPTEPSCQCDPSRSGRITLTVRRLQPLAPPVKFHAARCSAGAVHRGAWSPSTCHRAAASAARRRASTLPGISAWA